MSLNAIKALAFDTGGTILDWHTGFSQALAQAGGNHGLVRDWPRLANQLRRESLKKMLNLGEKTPPQYNFDGAHRATLEELIDEHGLEVFTEEERQAIAWKAVHHFQCWSDFPAVLPQLRERYICVSFTILSFRIIIDTARRNGLSWDAVISCEAIGKYKTLPESYQATAKFLQLDPQAICMVACHNFDLDAARAVGFKSAFVRRPQEWGEDSPPDPIPHPHHDIIVDSFPEMASKLGIAIG